MEFCIWTGAGRLWLENCELSGPGGWWLEDSVWSRPGGMCAVGQEGCGKRMSRESCVDWVLRTVCDVGLEGYDWRNNC